MNPHPYLETEIERRPSMPALDSGSSCWLLLVEVPPDGFGGFAGDDGGEGFGGGLLDVAEAAEVGDEALAGLGADAGDVEQL